MKKYNLTLMSFLIGLILVSSFKPAIQYQQGNQPTIAIGKKVYATYCLSCHQADGGGVPHLNPPLDGASLVQGNDIQKLINVLLQGMNERVEIDGEYYSNSMASHAFLTDAEIAAVLSYIRNSWGNKASIINAKTVKAIRISNKKGVNKMH